MARLDIGPVFLSECRRLSRQGWLFAVRSGVVLGLFAGLAAVWWRTVSRMDLSYVSQMAQAGEWYFEVIVAAQLAMVLLAAPAIAAGTFSTEMARGHVSLMLVTGLSPAEIVLGTLCARLVPVLGTVACALPVLALASVLGGIPPLALVRLEVVTLGTAVVGCSLALALSVLTHRLHESLMGGYLLLLGWVLGYPTLMGIQMTVVGRFIPGGWTGWFLEVNPFWFVLQPILSPHSYVPGEEGNFLGWSVALATGFALLAAWRLTPEILGRTSGGASPSRRRSWLPRSGGERAAFRSDIHLVFWRECCFRRPMGWVGILWRLYSTGAIIFSILAIAECMGAPVRFPRWAGLFNGFQATVGLGLLALTTPAALAEERSSGSLQVLLSTPIRSSGIVLGKWLAYFRTVVALAVLPTSVAMAHAFMRGRWIGPALVAATVLAHGAAVTGLGIALATWIPRLDRALILSAAASVLLTVAWVPLAVFIFGSNSLALGLASASPFLGVGVLTTEIAGASDSVWPVRVSWALFWILCASTIALALLGMTLATFDRCLGRITRVAVSPKRTRWGEDVFRRA
jgi:ABC-type transport system involved in multi-copper enzyme maturation permease subunit